ncbi:FliG C-terminal domain-containing protein [Paramagnetospirillum magneticum]|nr:FliG C-terminal domain-containing protein [Paramagnetospirillum magneticum]
MVVGGIDGRPPIIARIFVADKYQSLSVYSRNSGMIPGGKEGESEMASSPEWADMEFLAQAPTRETARDLCLLINDLCHLFRMGKTGVLEDTVDHPERSLLFYAYRQVRDRPWLAEPVRDIFRHITLGLGEAVQVERLLDSRIAAVAEEDRRYIRDTLAGMADTSARENLRERLNDAAAGKVLVLRALRNSLVAHVGGYAPMVAADYARFSLPDTLRMEYDELFDLIANSVRTRVGGAADLVLPVDPIDPASYDYDRRMARRLGEEKEEVEEAVEPVPDLEGRLNAIAQGWANDDPVWRQSVDRLAGYLQLIRERSLKELMRLVDEGNWAISLLGLPTPVVSRIFGLMSNGAQASLLRHMEEHCDFDGICLTHGAVSRTRESVLQVIEQKGLVDGGAARLKTIMHAPLGYEAFDALATLDDGELNALWRQTSKDTVGTALLGTTTEVAVRLLSRLSEDARQMMLDDMESLSAEKTTADIQQAQRDVLMSWDDDATMDETLAGIRAILAESAS